MSHIPTITLDRAVLARNWTVVYLDGISKQRLQEQPISLIDVISASQVHLQGIEDRSSLKRNYQGLAYRAQLPNVWNDSEEVYDANNFLLEFDVFIQSLPISFMSPSPDDLYVALFHAVEDHDSSKCFTSWAQTGEFESTLLYHYRTKIKNDLSTTQSGLAWQLGLPGVQFPLLEFAGTAERETLFIKNLADIWSFICMEDFPVVPSSSGRFSCSQKFFVSGQTVMSTTINCGSVILALHELIYYAVEEADYTANFDLDLSQGLLAEPDPLALPWLDDDFLDFQESQVGASTMPATEVEVRDEEHSNHVKPAKTSRSGKKNGNRAKPLLPGFCEVCLAHQSPRWRMREMQSVCNACGLRLARGSSDPKQS